MLLPTTRILPTLREVPRRRLGSDEHTPHVDGEHLVEVFEAKRVDRAKDVDARVVHQHVEPAEGLRALVDRPLQRGCVGAVGVQGDGVPTLGLDGEHQLARPLWLAHVRERDRGALACETLHHGGADAA